MKIQKKKWMTFAAAALIATGVLGMTSLAAGRADLNANTGGPGEKASVDVSTGEKPGDTQERQQDQQTAVITQILAVAGTGDCCGATFLLCELSFYLGIAVIYTTTL